MRGAIAPSHEVAERKLHGRRSGNSAAPAVRAHLPRRRHSYADAIARIHVQHTDRRPPGCGNADESASVPSEVLRPLLHSRIEKFDDLPGVGIDAGQVRTLAQIAGDTRQREICCFITASVLSRHDVFDLKFGNG
jgi:hypothetical protein